MNPLAPMKKAISSNIHAYDLALRLGSAKRNRSLRRAFSKVYPIDPLADFDAFREAVIELKSSCHRYSDWLELSLPCADSLFYGHLRALAEYAGIPYNDDLRLLMPSIEHGIHWLDEPCSSDKLSYIHNIVSQGAYRHAAIRSSRSIPHYVIGPFIHYAQPSYNDAEISRLKASMGRTLLVFPSHTYEASDSSYGRKQYVESVMSRFGGSFDTVLVSCYWNDVEDEVFRIFQAEGAHIVSCGLRNDPQFLRRLKSILLLSDCVTGNSLGTHIGYCVHLKKPFILFDGEAPPRINEPLPFLAPNAKAAARKNDIVDAARKLFPYEAATDERNSRPHQERNAFYALYWGGDCALKSPSEIKDIIAISEDMLAESHGRMGAFEVAYRLLLERYARCDDSTSRQKHELLAKALA